MRHSLLLSLVFIFISTFLSIGLSYAQPAPEQPKPTEEQPSDQEQTPTTPTGEGSESPPAGDPSSKINVDPIQPPADIHQQFTGDLKHYLNKQQITPLLAGNTDFLTLQQKQTAGFSRGVAILIPDWHQSATSPKSINQLRTLLPGQGWTTITMQPPSKPEGYPSVKENDLERAEENQQLIDDYQQQLSDRLKAVMAKAKEYPGIFLVVAEGANAAMLTKLYVDKKNETPNALVLLSGYLLTEEDNLAFANTLAKTGFPVLDLHLNKDHRFAISGAKDRQIEAERQLKVVYRQKQLMNFQTGYYPKQSLLKEINGWLKSIGW